MIYFLNFDNDITNVLTFLNQSKYFLTFLNYIDLGQVSTISPITERFVNEYNRIKDAGKMLPHADLIKAIGVTSKSNLSNILGKKQNIQPAAWEKFRILFDISEQPNGRQHAGDVLTGAHVTLQDHIDLLRDYNEKLFALLSSNLGKLYDGQQVMIAYQKAWVDYEAEKASAGDLQRKDEIKYKMSTLVDEQLHGDSSTYSQSGSGKRRKA